MMSSQPDRPVIEVAPRDGLLDQPLTVRLRSFPPARTVSLRARTQSDPDNDWGAEATFAIDSKGEVDLGSTAPIAGSYPTIDPQGLLWSLAPGASSAGRPLFDQLRPATITLTAEVDGQLMAETEIVRRAVDPAVTVRAIRDDGLVANLFVPPGDGPFPTVIVVGGSGGGFADAPAALFASHGYAALSLAYFNAPGLPDELLNIPLEYFAHAITWLSQQPEVDAERLAISGTSRGGELALLLASLHPKLRVVIAYVPSGYLWGAVSRLPVSEIPDAFPSWTLND